MYVQFEVDIKSKCLVFKKLYIMTQHYAWIMHDYFKSTHFVCVILVTSSNFDYERFYARELDKKKQDHSYRTFRKVMRNASRFPYAKEHTGEVKDITVWCSNDYHGMSWHPAVIKAVR